MAHDPTYMFLVVRVCSALVSYFFFMLLILYIDWLVVIIASFNITDILLFPKDSCFACGFLLQLSGKFYNLDLPYILMLSGIIRDRFCNVVKYVKEGIKVWGGGSPHCFWYPSGNGWPKILFCRLVGFTKFYSPYRLPSDISLPARCHSDFRNRILLW